MKKNILILATGGTIAGFGDLGMDATYTSGALDAKHIVEGVPIIHEIANIEVNQLYNLNSDDISWKHWLDLAMLIQDADKNPDVDGVVVLHGTDTMEETAYFLNLVCDSKIPVVITGAMLPTTSISPDGPLNLFQSVLVAVSDDAYDKPVMVVMGGSIMSARVVQKTSPSVIGTMKANELGQMGFVREKLVKFTKKDEVEVMHTSHSQFKIKKDSKMPKVNVIYFHVDADVEILKNAIEVSDAIVIAGAGAGEYSEDWKKVIDEANIPIVVSSRTMNGVILQGSVLSKNTIAASYLTPQKAAVLLKVGLSDGIARSHEEWVDIFASY